MASAVGKAVLEVIEEEKLQQHCKTVGTYFLKELEKFRAEFSNVGDVRGKGFMIGIEMVENKETRKQLALEKVLDIFEDLKDEGLLVGRGGHYGNVISRTKLIARNCTCYVFHPLTPLCILGFQAFSTDVCHQSRCRFCPSHFPQSLQKTCDINVYFFSHYYPVLIYFEK